MGMRLKWATMLAVGGLLAGGCIGGTTKPSIAAEPTASADAPVATSLPTDAATPAVTTIPVMIKGYVVRVELARTPAEQELGLMHRTSMPKDRGMLFVFPRATVQAFWMKDTQLPLSIAFIDANKVITNIADMQPLDEVTIHRSTAPVPYALEVNQGWFAEHGIQAGDQVEFALP